MLVIFYLDLELAIPTTKQSKLEDDAALSLLCLAKTPVSTIAPVLSTEPRHSQSQHTDKIDHLIGALQANQPPENTELAASVCT